MPIPPLITEAQWIEAAIKYVEERGLEQFLVNLVFVPRQSFASFEEG